MNVIGLIYRNTPAPKSQWDSNFDQLHEHIIIEPNSHIPKYGQRLGWQRDFGDGGAYSEIQYCSVSVRYGQVQNRAFYWTRFVACTHLEEFRWSIFGISSRDGEGNVRYDALACQDHSNDRIIQFQYKDLVPLNQRTDIGTWSLDRLSEEETQETSDKIIIALESVTQKKIKSAQRNNVKTKTNKTQFFCFSPNSSDGTPGHQRIMKMVDVQQDPMEPPKFKARKIPRGPTSPPPPILHSPPRKVPAKGQEEWMSSTCVSNWKNPKGGSIPLDMRLASDGRGLANGQTSDEFAEVAEALPLAGRHSREEIRERSIIQQNLAEKENQTKEETLRQFAQKAREVGVTHRKSFKY